MQIKRFEARNMTTALRMIKKELGPDAVILSARSLKKENKIIGVVKSVGVEVTAAVDGYHLPAALKPALTAGALNNYRRNETASLGAPPKLNFRQSAGGRIKSLYNRKRTHQASSNERSGRDDLLADVFQHLLSQEVKRDIANDIIDALNADYPTAGQFDTKTQIISGISNILNQKINKNAARFHAKSDRQLIAVVGSTGVGKTTTVAKLAAWYTFEGKKDVALISVDADRIAGTADLKVYAKAIGVPVKAADTPSAFKAAVNELKRCDVILVDTSGFNPQRPDQIDELKAFMDGVGFVEIHLALSAMAKESDLLNTLSCLNSLDVQHLIFTKLDESCTCGNIVNVWVRHPLPLSFITHGREVPSNIKTGSVDKIVERLLAGFNNSGALPKPGRSDEEFQAAADGEDSSGFVANKNSDVFHRRDCKWTQKIKSKHMVSFPSAQEAQLANFVPCQDCRPARSSRLQDGLSERDNKRISNYS